MLQQNSTIELAPQNAIIALGSNQGDSLSILKSALQLIDKHPAIKIIQCSSFYLTEPVGYKKQPYFINAVCEVKTLLKPISLLAWLQTIEKKFKRTRYIKNGPRTLDLDLIDFAKRNICTDKLILPHPRAHQRNFVVIPLVEILPNHPLKNRLSATHYKTLLQRASGQSVTLIPENKLLFSSPITINQ